MARRSMRSVAIRPRKDRNLQTHVVAPIKGLNTVSAITETDPAFGLSIQNFVATPQGLSLRKGYRKWATGMPDAVTTLIPYHTGDTSPSKHFAISGGNLYDVTNPGPVGAPVVTGLALQQGWWQHANMTHTTNGKHYLVAVNGVDAPLFYDGNAWTRCTQVASPSAPGQFALTDNNGAAVNLSDFIDITQHQQRLWFVRKNSTKAYYTDIGQAAGALYAFDFGAYFPRGGALHKLAIWTTDTGSASGSQSLLVAISTRGDVAIYMGNNPASASSWSLSYQYQIGAPVGRRCTCQLTGDLMVLSQDGLYPLSKYVMSDRVSETAALTYTIAPTISDLVSTFADRPGFEMIIYPGLNAMLLNVPQYNANNNFQFCFHTITNGWTQLTNMPAHCWSLFNDSMFFGAYGTVYLSFIGYYDDAEFDGTGGQTVVGNALTAFNHFDEVPGLGRGVQKQVKMVKPYIVSGALNPSVKVGVNVDFNMTQLLGTAAAQPSNGGVWDASLWDAPSSYWAGALTTYNQWATVSAYPGEAIALAVSISSTSDILWTGTNFLIEPGNQIS